MTDLPKHKMTAEEFLAWAEEQLPEAGKFELWDGEVVLRHGPGGFEERSEHRESKTAMVLTLHDAIERAGLPYRVAADGPMVRLAPSRMAKPDVLIYCGPKAPRGVQGVPNPIILLEVLSPPPRSGTAASSCRAISPCRASRITLSSIPTVGRSSIIGVAPPRPRS
jgi:Uma2 family endonuclease